MACEQSWIDLVVASALLARTSRAKSVCLDVVFGTGGPVLAARTWVVKGMPAIASVSKQMLAQLQTSN